MFYAAFPLFIQTFLKWNTIINLFVLIRLLASVIDNYKRFLKFNLTDKLHIVSFNYILLNINIQSYDFLKEYIKTFYIFT